MLLSSLYRACSAFRMAAVRSVHPTPPNRKIVERDWSRSRSKDQRSRSEIAVVRLRRTRGKLLLQVLPNNFMFRRGYIPSRFNKLGELRVSYIVLFHPKTLDLNEVSRPLVGKTLLVIGSHQKRASGDPNHARGRLL